MIKAGWTVLHILTVASLAQAELTGEQIISKSFNRNDGDTAVSWNKMTITKGKSKKQRSFIVIGQDDSKGSQSLVRFSQPKIVAKTALLTDDDYAADSRQWLFLPADSKTIRIQSSRLGGRFVGSSLFFEDMRRRPPEKDNHKLISSEKLNGVDCWVVESIPKDSSTSVYKRRRSWIHKQTLIPVQSMLYNEKGLQKVYRTKKVQKVDGIWTVMSASMANKQTGRTTDTEVLKIIYNKKLPKGLLGPNQLENTQRESQFVQSIQ